MAKKKKAKPTAKRRDRGRRKPGKTNQKHLKRLKKEGARGVPGGRG